jgi:hypothetical protein
MMISRKMLAALGMAAALWTAPARGVLAAEETLGAESRFPPEYLELARRVAVERPSEDLVTALDSGETVDLPGLMASLRESSAALRAIRSDDPFIAAAAQAAARGAEETTARLDRALRGEETSTAPVRGGSGKVGSSLAALAAVGLMGGAKDSVSESAMAEASGGALLGSWAAEWWSPAVEALLGGVIQKLLNRALDAAIESGINWWTGGSAQRARGSLVVAAVEMETARRLLPAAARRHAPAPVADGQEVLGLDFDGSWNASSQEDALRVYNLSGQDLTNATLLIEVIDAEGKTAQDIRFAPSLKARESVALGLSRGISAEAGQSGLQTWLGRASLANAAEIRVSIWCDQLSREKIALQYAGSERGRDMARLFSEVGFQRVDAESYADGWFWDSHPSIVLKMKGRGPADRLENLSGKARFIRADGEAREFAWSVAEWSNGAEIEFEAEGITWEPAQVEILFETPDYIHRLSFPIPPK